MKTINDVRDNIMLRQLLVFLDTTELKLFALTYRCL